MLENTSDIYADQSKKKKVIRTKVKKERKREKESG